jgi:D-alanyl-D-alanine carboxypeptidase/D-alanyl-D-alanine-endopeptidase (penicillin-binding protein 4)
MTRFDFYKYLSVCLGAVSCALCASAQALPDAVQSKLSRYKIPPEAISVVLYERKNTGDASSVFQPLISHNALTPRNPASLMKLVTTSAALDLLGPAYAWVTQVYIDGPVQGDVLKGNLYIKGSGDPKLGVERLWLLMRRVRGLGIKSIQGDIVLDRTMFAAAEQDPSEFDAEPLKPYNVGPDALLINFKSLLISFVPDPMAKVARVHVEPPLYGVSVQPSVPLQAGECSDYRADLKANFQNPNQITFKGSYALSCAERVWPVAYPDPKSFADRAIREMWSEVGGALSGGVRSGVVPAQLKPVFAVQSPPLAEVIRDINKFSNNVMAQQLFFTLGQEIKGQASPEASLSVLSTWWQNNFPNSAPRFVNGSGLSRDTQMTAQDLAKLLIWDFEQPIYPELASSLPLLGVDGTLRQSKAKTKAHIKTGSLRDVLAVAGYVLDRHNQPMILVVIINHPLAQTARPLIDYIFEYVSAN